MTNPVAQSAYSLKYVAEYLNMKPTTLREKVLDYPECFPPYTLLGRTSKQDGTMMFPRNMFEQWLEKHAVTSLLSSSESDEYRKHA